VLALIRQASEFAGVLPMSTDEAKRRSALIAAAEQIVRESGNPTSFDGAAWLDQWLIQPVPALGWKCPVDYLGTDEGCELFIQLLRQSKDGVYA